MDKILIGVLICDHNESTKVLLFRKLREYVNKLDDTDFFKDAVLFCFECLHEKANYSESFFIEINGLLACIETHLSDIAVLYLSQKIIDSFDRFLDPSFPKLLLVYVKKLLRRHVLICLRSTVKEPGNLLPLNSGLYSVLKCRLLENDKQLCLNIQYALDNISSQKAAAYDLCDKMYIDLLSNMFQMLLTLCSQVFLENLHCNSLEVELAQSLSRSLIVFVTQPRLSNSSSLNSCVLTEHINSLVQDILVDTNSDHHHIPVACILSELQHFCSNNALLTESVCRFIDQLSQCRISTIESCFVVLRRLTAWLAWTEMTTHRCALDIWLIGFQCEMLRRFSPNKSQLFATYWSEFISWQLKFLLELMERVIFPHESTVNALTFFILYREGRHDKCAYDIVSYIAPILNKMICMYVDDPSNEHYKDILLRMYATSRLLDAMVSAEDDHTSRNFLQKTNCLTDLLEKFHNQFIDENDVDVWSSRSKIYSLEALVKFASQAGIRIRNIWERWDITSSIRLRNTYSGAAQKANRSVTGYSGLLNVGNTCYANAALQLLYHCSEFRNALLGFHKPDTLTSTAVTSCSSLSNFNLSNNLILPVSHPVEGAWPSDSEKLPVGNQGILHAHLFSLFRSLDTHQIPTVRDLRAVLTLTKPAHFVSGEQQDAAEYLNYLLDRLHEEELHCQRQRSLSLNSYSDSSTLTPDATVDSSSVNIKNAVENASFAYSTHTQSYSTESTEKVDTSSSTNSTGSSSSIVARLFGGTLLRHTSCVECQHVSSSRQEQFTCLYVPLTKPKELLYQDQTPNEDLSFVNDIPESNDSDILDDEIVEPGTDLSSLIQSHFTQIEHVASSTQCESCGKRTIQARSLKLQHLSSHVLICLNLFRYCRVKQTCSKIMHRVRIPERLSVTVSSSPASASSNTETYGYNNISTSNDDSSKSKCNSRTYSLQAMILHSGLSISCGHYTCVAKVGMQWILFDDDNADYTTLEDVYSEPLATPYLLLYSQT